MANSFLTLLITIFSAFGVALFTYVKSNYQRYRKVVAPILRIATIIIALIAFGIATEFKDQPGQGDAPVVAVQIGVASFLIFLYSFLVVPIVRIFNGHRSTSPRRNTWKWNRTGVRDHGVLLIGDGFVGKSQIIKTLNGDFSPIHAMNRTDNFHLVQGPVFQYCRLSFYDFRGQDFSKLAEMIDEFSLSDGRVNSLVFVVDPFSPPEKEDKSDGEYQELAEEERFKRYTKLDQMRAEHHHQRLGSGLLDILVPKIGVSSDPNIGLKSVCLFVNKLDKWSRWNRKTDSKAALQLYDGLFNQLQNRFDSGIRLERVAGSALEGIGICGRKSLLQNILGPISNEGRPDA